MEETMKIVESLEESGLLENNASETIENESEQKVGFLSMLLGALGVSLFENMLVVKGVIRAVEGTIRAAQNV